MSPRGKHAPASPSSFYMSLGRHAAAAVAVVAVVALVVAMATREDDPEFGGEPLPSASESVTASPTASPTGSPTTSPTQSPAREPRERERIIVSVYNGTSRGGLASSTSERIVQAGFRVENVGNAQPRAKTIIFYRPGFAPEARLLLEDFPELLRVKAAGDNPEVDPDAMLTVLLGADYQT